MAERPAWTLKEGIKKENFTFEWNGSFSLSQKKKNIACLHEVIRKKYGERVLEVSTKSEVDIGKALSAFNLKLDGCVLECVFQASKVYDRGGPYDDMRYLQPKDAKRDERHTIFGKLKRFVYNGEVWELEPKTAFYDYIYVLAAFQTLSIEEIRKVCDYAWFTDIEFNPNRSINCQAQAVVILKYIIENNCESVFENKATWLNFYYNLVRETD